MWKPQIDNNNFFFRILWGTESCKELHLFDIKIICNIMASRFNI